MDNTILIPSIGWPIIVIIIVVCFYYLGKFEEYWGKLALEHKIGILWPRITNNDISLVVAYRCAFLVYIISGWTIVFPMFMALLNKTKIYQWWFLDGIIMFIVGYGIQKMSRVAGVFGLILFIINKIYTINMNVSIISIVGLIFIGMFYVNAIRATMVYQKNRLTLNNAKS